MKRFIGWVFTFVLLISLSSFPAFSDDSELFTNVANPDVLLVVDASPSMNTIDPLATPAVPNLNENDPGTGNQRFDIIWKVLYTLLNYDASTPSYTPTFPGTLKSATTAGATRFEVTATYYNLFPAPATGNRIVIGLGTGQELVGWTSKSTTGSGSSRRYWINVTPSLTLTHSAGEKFDFYTTYSSSSYPQTNTLAEDASYINNIDSTDMASLKLRLGLMTYTSSGSSSGYGYGGLIENQQWGTGHSPVSPNGPPFSPTYRDLWNNVISTSGNHGVRDKGTSTPTTLALKYDVPQYFTNAYDTNATCRTKFVILLTDGEDTRGLGGETNTNPRYYYPGKTGAACGAAPNNYPADQYSGCFLPETSVPPYSTATLPSGSATNRFYPNAWENFSTGTPGGQLQRHNWLIAQGQALKNANIQLFVVGVGLSGTQTNAATGPKTAQPMNVALRHVLRRLAQQAGVPTTAAELYNIGTGYGGAVEDGTISIVPDPVTGKPIQHAYFATSADELSQALGKIIRSITSTKYSFTAPTVATVRTTDKNYLYTAYFEPGSSPDTLWPGHIYSRSLYDNGAINPTILWDAAAPDNVSLSIPVSSSASSRRIFCGLPAASPPWTRGYFSTGSSSWGDPGVTATDLGVASGADNVIAWVRGAYFDNNAKLGDTYHSKPVLVSNPNKNYFDEGYQAFATAKEFRPRVLYAGANDGMLHAFHAGTYNSSTKTWSNGTGEELFGFIPNTLLNNVQKMVETDDSDHTYFVDSSPQVSGAWWDTGTPGNNIKESSEWRTILIGGMRKGGEGYYALDVTDPPTGGDYTNFPKVLWEYSDTSLVAESWSEPYIGKVKILDSGGVARDRFVAILGAGPNVGGGSIGKAVIVLDVQNGQVLRTFTGMDNGVAASPTAILDSSGYIRFAYVVDINGNLWKFDFRSPGNATSTPNSDSIWTATKLFTPAAAGRQPAYHRVEVAYTSTDGSSRYLFYGTGDQEKPVTNPGSGKFYAIKDTDIFFPSTPIVESSSTLLDVTPTIANNAAGGTVSTSQSGWVVKLGNVTQSYDGYSHSGEKVLSDPVVFYGQVYFTTYTTNLSNLCGGGIARVYGLNYQTGAAGMFADPTAGEPSGTGAKVPYHVYGSSGLASSPSLSINPSGQSSIYIGFSASQTPLKIDILSPSQTKVLKSWKELF